VNALYEMKYLVPNYSCLQNPGLGGYRPQIPVLSVLCPQLNLLNPPNKIPGYASDKTLAPEDKRNGCSVQRARIAAGALLCGRFPGFTPLFFWLSGVWRSSFFYDVTLCGLVVTNASGQHTGTIFRGQTVQEECPKRR